MNPVLDFAAKSVGRAAREACNAVAPAFRIYARMGKAYLDFCLGTTPEKVVGALKRLGSKGEKYCRGPLAYKRMPAGIVMRDAAAAGLKPFDSFAGALAVHALSFAVPAVAAKLALLPATPLLASIFPCALAGIAAFPLALAAISVAVPAALCLAGALLGLPRAVINIGTGREVTREWHREQERQKKPRELYTWEVESLPRLQRSFHYALDKVEEAPAHERVQWLEGFKQKFPEDFAKAAVLDPEDLASTLHKKMQVPKKTLQVKKPKRGLAQKITGVFGR